MTVADAPNRIQYIGNGVTSTFSTGTIVFYANTDLVVTETVIATGISTPYVLTTDYTVSGGNGASGSITLVAGALPSTKRITIERVIPYSQQDDYIEGENVLAETLETAFDKAVIRDQQLRDGLSRAIKVSPTSSFSGDLELPEPAASKILGWNSSGTALENKSVNDFSETVVTSFIETLFDDSTAGEARATLEAIGDGDALSSLKASTSAGISLKNNAGNNVLLLGAGGGTGATLYGGFNAVGAINVSGQSSGPATLSLAEDTDNGTNKVTLTAPASIASDYNIEIPSHAGTIVAENRSAVVSTASGTSIDFTGIPSTAKEITLQLVGVSTDATAQLLFQLGDSGGIEATGYDGASSVIGASTVVSSVSTTGFLSRVNQLAGESVTGILTFRLFSASTNTWTCEGQLANAAQTATITTTGAKSTSATLDRIRMTTVAGTATFDAGSAVLTWK